MKGGPIVRFGGKGRNAPHLHPHFARARLYLEPFFGAGGMFYSLPQGLYKRSAVNDLDASMVTFFRVLRDRTDDLVRVCEATPYARDEFAACLEHSEDELEEARRVWVRSRQGFAGNAVSAGNWGRDGSNTTGWKPLQANTKLSQLREYAAALRLVTVDNIDGAEFVKRWAGDDTFVYADPPYVASTRVSKCDYVHEMDDAAHERLSVELHSAVSRGAMVAISGYPSALYDRLYAGWRCVAREVGAMAGASTRTAGRKRTECLWMSYPEEREMRMEKAAGTLLKGAA